MATTIIIPTPLRQFAGGLSEIAIEAATAGEALERLAAEHIGLKRHLFGDNGNLRSFINVYVGDEDIRDLDGLSTPIKDGEILIVPSIAGGRDPERLPDLSHGEYSRYARHLILPEVGLEGQRRLKNARVLMIGTGGLGSPLALYLSAAGIGTIGVVDFDVVDESNLQRQIIHGTKDVGRKKIDSARDRITDINPNTRVEAFETRLTSANAVELFNDFDVIVDGTDNFPTRYLVNDACVLTRKPNVYGSIFRFEGQASVFWAEKGACYRCLYPEPPPPGLVPSCAEGGVLGVLPGIVGTIQANEVIKVILGADGILLNRLLTFDAWKMKFRELKLKKNPSCPICGPNPTLTSLIDYEEFCGLKQKDIDPIVEITANELREIVTKDPNVQIIDVREPFEFEVDRIPGSILIPLGEIANRADEIDEARPAIVHCKAGVRSAKAIRALREIGFNGDLINLAGGIDAWNRLRSDF